MTILLVEQNARMALSITDRGYVIQNGEIKMGGPAAEALEIRCKKGVSRDGDSSLPRIWARAVQDA